MKQISWQHAKHMAKHLGWQPSWHRGWHEGSHLTRHRAQQHGKHESWHRTQFLAKHQAKHRNLNLLRGKACFVLLAAESDALPLAGNFILDRHLQIIQDGKAKFILFGKRAE